MNKSTFYSLDNEYKSDKHMGTSIKDDIDSYTGFIVWCLENLSHLRISPELIEIIRDTYPDYQRNSLLDNHELYEPDFEEDDYYDRNDGYYEEHHYEEFAGSYVQEEMGWSDEMIDDALDGDPDAYWNID